MLKKRNVNYHFTNVRKYDNTWIGGSVDVFSNLPDVALHNNSFWYVRETTWNRLLWTQKKRWLYVSTWLAWEYVEAPLASTVAEANLWTSNDTYISPYVLEQILWVVDNTSDLNKPISIATQNALNDLQAQIMSLLWDSFESVAKNIKAFDATLNYTSWKLTSIVYDSWVTITTKTLNYTGDKLTSIVLSWDLPWGIQTTKTLSYTWDNLTSITYT